MKKSLSWQRFIIVSESLAGVIGGNFDLTLCSDPEEQEKEEAAKAEAAKAEAESAKVDTQAPETWVGDVPEAEAAAAAPAAPAVAVAGGVPAAAGAAPVAAAAAAAAAAAPGAPAAPVDDWGQTVSIVLLCTIRRLAWYITYWVYCKYVCVLYIDFGKYSLLIVLQGDDWASPATGTTEDWGGAGDNTNW